MEIYDKHSTYNTPAGRKQYVETVTKKVSNV